MSDILDGEIENLEEWMKDWLDELEVLAKRDELKQERLKQYKKRFGEELSQRYICAMSDEEIIEVINECLEANKDYYQLLYKRGEDIII